MEQLDVALDGVAFDHPATRHAIARHALVPATGAVLAVLLLLGALVQAQRAGDPIPAGARRSPATVVDERHQRSGWGGTTTGWVTVRFLVDGEPRDAEVDVGSRIGEFAVGDQVTVLDDPADPGWVRIEGVTSDRSGRVPAGLLAGLGVGIALLATIVGRHVRWARRLAHRHPWVPVRAWFAPVQTRAGPMPRGDLVGLRAPWDAQPVVLETIGLRRPTTGIEPVAWVAGPEGRQVLVAEPGGGRLRVYRIVQRPGIRVVSVDPPAPVEA